MKGKVKVFFASIGYLLLTVVVQLAVSVIGGMVVGLYYVISEMGQISNSINTDLDSLLEFTLSLTNVFLLISSILTVLALILIYKIKKRNYTEELQIKKTKNFNIYFAIIIGIACWLFNTGVLSLIDEAGLFSSRFQHMSEILAPLDKGNIIIAIITVGIAAPLAEEFLFRGVIYNTLSKKISIKWTIIIQAILFGVFHGNLVQGTYATLLGLVFGYVTYKTKSLWPAIIMHMVNNSIATIVSYIASNYLGGTLVYILFAIIGVIGAATFLVLVKKKNVNDEEFINFNNINNLN